MDKTIVVEGPIGVGKTSLARRLADHFRTRTLFEQAQDNPFLRDFYRDPENHALKTQLYFLLQRRQQIEAICSDVGEKAGLVGDFLPEKDALFAELTLSEAEYAMYRQISQLARMPAFTPDLVIYLQAPAATLMRRVESRGIGYEQAMGSDYLRKVARAYSNFFHDYDAAPMLVINAERINPIASDEDFDALVEKIGTIDGGRHYFNPLPATG